MKGLQKISNIIEYVAVENIIEVSDQFYASTVVVTQNFAKERQIYNESPWKNN